MEDLKDLRMYATSIDNLAEIELDTKYKDMEEIKEELQSEFQHYQARLEEEQNQLTNIIKDYEFEISQIMMIEDSEEMKKEFVKLCEKIDLNSIMDTLKDVIEDAKEIKNCIDSLDNMVYSNGIAKDEIIYIVDKLESEELWKLYNSL